MRQHHVVGSALATLICVLPFGCVYHRTAAYATYIPRVVDEIPAVASLQIAADQVHVVAADVPFGLVAPNGERLRETAVHCGESFQSLIFNGKATYELQSLEDESAVFDVRRGFMSCVFPFVKHIESDLIRVRPYNKAN